MNQLFGLQHRSRVGSVVYSTTYPAKWQSLIDAGQASLIEGGGYLSKGVWRAQEDCRMRTNDYPDFCPVCQQALRKLIEFLHQVKCTAGSGPLCT